MPTVSPGKTRLDDIAVESVKEKESAGVLSYENETAIESPKVKESPRGLEIEALRLSAIETVLLSLKAPADISEATSVRPIVSVKKKSCPLRTVSVSCVVSETGWVTPSAVISDKAKESVANRSWSITTTSERAIDSRATRFFVSGST
jgi:hypothetical protein